MKTIIKIPVVTCALAFELSGRVLAQMSDMSLGIAIMLLSTVSKKE